MLLLFLMLYLCCGLGVEIPFVVGCGSAVGVVIVARNGLFRLIYVCSVSMCNFYYYTLVC